MPSETGCGLVFMTGGTFALGDTGAYRAAPLQNMVTVNAFALDAYEVTVDRFRRFWNAGHPAPAGSIVYPSGSLRWEGTVNEPIATAERCNWTQRSLGAHPINCVDWWTAQAFCVWDGARLPTEAEWEFAARQQPGAGLTANRRFPWGNTPPAASCDRAHWNRCPGNDGTTTRRVGSFAPSAGFFDLAGNVWEWTGDLFSSYAESACWGGVARENPRCTTSATGFPTIRGGSWVSTSTTLLAGASRDDAYRPTTRSALVGFRCARSR
jgi:formylglycine-generating enzyme required for sulfatase activity